MPELKSRDLPRECQTLEGARFEIVRRGHPEICGVGQAGLLPSRQIEALERRGRTHKLDRARRQSASHRTPTCLGPRGSSQIPNQAAVVSVPSRWPSSSAVERDRSPQMPQKSVPFTRNYAILGHDR